MSLNILVGLGGTGARVVEAALVLNAAGHGPLDGTYVGVIDQDGQNGNSGRTQEVFRALQLAQSKYGKNESGFPGPSVGSLYRKDFVYREGENIIIKPGGDKSLSDLLDRRHLLEKQELLEQLFNEDELSAPHELGYQGRAHVGAAAIHLALENEDSDLNILKRMIEEGGDNQEVRIVLAGSAFGGTGASCFPTIARAIAEWKVQDSKGKKRESPLNVRIAGVLLLPYFGFEDTEDGYALKSTELLSGTRQALDFYSDLLNDEPGLFDRLYLTGWDDMIHLNYNAKGGRSQKNPPLPPDLLAAAAVMDFLRLEKKWQWADDAQAFSKGGALICGRNGKKCTWEDIPGHDAIRPKLAGLIRLAFFTRYRLAPDLALGSPTVWREMINPKNEADKLVSLTNVEAKEKKKEGIFDHVLQWAAALQLFADKYVELWTAEFAKAAELKPQDGVTLVSIPDVPMMFDKLISQKKYRRLHQVYAELADPRSWYGASTQVEPHSLLHVAEKATRLGDAS